MNTRSMTKIGALIRFAVLPLLLSTVIAAHGENKEILGGQKYTDVDLSYNEYSESEECKAVEISSKEGTDIKLNSAFPLPPNFKGHVIYDADTKRLFGVLFGPPANAHRVSRLYEFDSSTGKILREATLPFVGTLGQAVYKSGYLFQPVPHKSTLHKLSVSQKTFGDVVATYDLPTVLDLKLEDQELLRFTFIAFSGMTWADDRNLVIHSEDLGELITINHETGKVVKRVPVDRALRAITIVPGANDRKLLIANSDPADARRKIEERRFMFRGIHGVHKLVPDCYPEGKRALHWQLIDPESGEVLAKTNPMLTHLQAGSASFMKYEKVKGSKFGRYHFVTHGIDGIEFLSWEPKPLERESVSKL